MKIHENPQTRNPPLSSIPLRLPPGLYGRLPGRRRGRRGRRRGAVPLHRRRRGSVLGAVGGHAAQAVGEALGADVAWWEPRAERPGREWSIRNNSMIHRGI